VVVLGAARHDLTAMPWTERGPHLWPTMAAAFDELRRGHELVVIEGAGSPAEINLADVVNNRVLAHADAAAVLVVDIDRGGAFAHLYGTWALVPDETRARLRGFVLNKFRGDPTLLEPGPALITERTGMAALGVLPMLRHELPDEEGATVRARPPEGGARAVVVRYPFASNLDELHVLAHAARLRFATTPAELEDADLMVLPGSKHVAADLEWIRHWGFDDALARAAARGARVLGICGGAMMLGERVDDPHGVEGAARGLGLLPLVTTMARDKVTRRTVVELAGLPVPWRALEGCRVSGYEIRNGRVAGAGSGVAGRDDAATGDDRVWARANVLATTVHGLLEDPGLLEALVGVRPEPVLERTFEALADALDEHLDGDRLWELVRG
jgi:adenosylcobyric acid synthase